MTPSGGLPSHAEALELPSPGMVVTAREVGLAPPLAVNRGSLKGQFVAAIKLAASFSHQRSIDFRMTPTDAHQVTVDRTDMYP